MVYSIHHPRYRALRAHLKTLREQAGLTQRQLAEKLHDEQSYISKIERGERYIDALFYFDWCQACGVAPNVAIKTLIEPAGEKSKNQKKSPAQKTP